MAHMAGLAQQLQELIGVTVRSAIRSAGSSSASRRHRRGDRFVRARDRAGNRGLMRAVNLLPENTSSRRIGRPSGVAVAGAAATLAAVGAVVVLSHGESVTVASRQARVDDLQLQLARCRAANGDQRLGRDDPHLTATRARPRSSRHQRHVSRGTSCSGRSPASCPTEHGSTACSWPLPARPRRPASPRPRRLPNPRPPRAS